MATKVFSANMGTSTFSSQEILASTAFPYRNVNVPAPAGAAKFEIGCLVKRTDAGVVSKYEAADTEPVYGIIADNYEFNGTGDSGTLDIYVFGAFEGKQWTSTLSASVAENKIFTDTGASATVTNKVALTDKELIKCRVAGLYIS